ncbi:alpha/beta fold hydrolase [Paraburkholderia sp. IW21]|uniref:alpha/beta fold hydrolase n=1 Tax=Paraburkholderia sp. IW21 TaxID=3242488 RepID=UPI003520D67C
MASLAFSIICAFPVTIVASDRCAANETCQAHDSVVRLQQRIQRPTLVTAGDADPACSPTATARLSEGLPHARTEMFERASHFFLMEQPAKFERLLVDWLKKHA